MLQNLRGVNVANRTLWLIILLALCVGSLGRVYLLEKRPFHADEANQAYRTGKMLDGEIYRYNANDHHGPTLYYLTLPVLRLLNVQSFAESKEFHYRILPAVFGILLVLLSVFLHDSLGKSSALWASLFTAISPAMVYYNRYYIQETLLVLFSFIFILSGWHYLQTKKHLWLLVVAISAALMHATKETCVLVWGAAAAAAVLVFFVNLKRTIRDFAPPIHHSLIAVFTFLIVSGLFYSSFLHNLPGILDSFTTYVGYVKRGTDQASIHRHSCYYYFQLLLFTKRSAGPIWTEAFPFFLAVFASCLSFTQRWDEKKRHFVRFLFYYTLLLSLFYSVIPYKTPWCLLGFWHGFLILAGIGAAEISTFGKNYWQKLPLVAMTLFCLIHLVRLSYLTNFVYPSDVRNPYVYAHTSTAIFRLRDRLDAIRALSPTSSENLQIAVIAEGNDYWPLPWYLRHFRQAGYWSAIPDTIEADVVVVASNLANDLEKRLNGSYHVEFHALRPNALLKMYIKDYLWQAILRGIPETL